MDGIISLEFFFFFLHEKFPLFAHSDEFCNWRKILSLRARVRAKLGEETRMESKESAEKKTRLFTALCGSIKKG